MTDQQFTEYFSRYEQTINKIARKFAKRDDDLYDDLVQIGRVKLWKLELSQATSNEDPWIRTSIANAMRDHKRKEKAAEQDSLHHYLSQGDQVITDDLSGESRLIRANQLRRRTEIDDHYESGDSDEER
jgi:RNA polymerase sigma factor (sigma-70 family)